MTGKRLKMAKGALCLIFAFLLSINSFAAIVSDNDGSAFVTKAEFEAMKRDFAEQVTNYNNSIDRKIDGAIAAYLAGIKTVTSEASKVLVDNYSDMIWVSDYNIYGKWKKWTDNTTYTSDTTNRWFAPSLNEKRHTFRDRGGNIYSNWSQAWTYQTTGFEYTANAASNGVSSAVAAGWAREAFSGVPVLTLQLRKDDEGNWLVNKPLNVYAMSPHSMSKDHGWTAATGESAYAWANRRWIVTGIEILDKAATEILKFKVTARRLDTSAAPPAEGWTYTDTLTPENFPFPCTWCDDDHNAGGAYTDKFDTQTQAYNASGITVSNYFSTGCTWHKFDGDSRTKQYEFLKNMMLGRTNSQQVNAAYYVIYRGERGQYDFSKSTTSGSWSGNIRALSTRNRYLPIQSDGITTDRLSVSTPISFAVPHWPTENLRDLTSGRFVYNNKGLKYGEGFPLRIDNQTNGYLQISFDYSCQGIINGGKLSNQDLRIDMRKENFLSTETNWVEGYKGLVNPDSTSESLVTLGGYRYSTTDGKIKLTVPMKRDESLWIRICPWDSTKGYCVRWSNLHMTMNTN